MSKALNRLRRVHQFCVDQSFYPLVLSTLLGFAIFAGRVYLSRNSTYAFLIWNLFLAWIPYVCSLLAVLLFQNRTRTRWLAIVPALLWLIFLPNAPYIITDIVHLRERNPVPFWYDIGLFITFAWTGLFLGVVSLSAMQTLVRRVFGSIMSWLFVFGAAGLSGLGIYMGRYLNWNSWDLLINPDDVVLDMAQRVIHPLHNLQAWGVSLMFAALLLVCYLTFVSMRQQAISRDVNPKR
jgi:uncharacterized membrane protein